MQAFELRSQHKKRGSQPFTGGSFALPDGKTYDVAEALEKGNGTIVTDDPHVIDNLDQLEVLKSVPVPESKKAAAAATDGGEGR